MRTRILAPLLVIGGAIGCESGAAEDASLLVQADRPSVVPAPPRAARPAGQPVAFPRDVELDRRPDGARLTGALAPVRPNADAERVVVLKTGGALPSLDGARVLDARFAAGGVVYVDADHVLRFHHASGSVELDRGAYGPLAVAGSEIAYVRGSAPRLELARANVTTRTAQQLTTAMAPCWSPALTPDGASVVFVSAVAGSPRLYRVDRGGTPRALGELGRIPDSPVGPRFEQGLYTFDDQLGTVWADLDTGRIVRTTRRQP